MIFYKMRSSSSTDYRSPITDHRSFADNFSLKSTLILLLITLTLIISYPIPARAQTNDAAIRVSIKPEGEVRVGQRVTLNIEFMATTWFSGTPLFDMPDISGAVVLKVGSFAVNSSENIDGITYSIQGHEFAIFVQRPGSITIQPFNVRFFQAGPGTAKAREVNRKTPEIQIKATMPPGAEKFSTLISTEKLEVSEKWEPVPETAKVGDAFTRKITMRADDVPGMAFPPLPVSEIKGLGIYLKDPDVMDKTDRGDFIGERTETITYVCEEAGAVTLPEVVLHWWDMENKELKTNTLPAVKLRVKPNQQLIKGAGSTTPVSSYKLPVIWMITSVFFFAASLGVYFKYREAISKYTRAWNATKKESEKACFKHFKTACRSGNPTETYNTLLNWLDKIHSGKYPATLNWLISISNEPVLSEQATVLKSVLFQKNKPDTQTWDSGLFFKEVAKTRKLLLKKKSVVNTKTAYAI